MNAINETKIIVSGTMMQKYSSTFENQNIYANFAH